MADLDPLPDFSPPRSLDNKPCLRGNVYTYCVPSCQFLNEKGEKIAGCVFFPRSLKAGETRTKESYTKQDKQAMRTKEVVPGFQVWQIEED